jgi:excinuclease ABC subunit C
VLQAVRDETHRFATSLNKKMRKKDSAFSLLESVAGVGPVRSRKLMQHFSSLENLLSAEPSHIASSCGIPLEVAERIKKELTIPQ